MAAFCMQRALFRSLFVRIRLLVCLRTRYFPVNFHIYDCIGRAWHGKLGATVEMSANCISMYALAFTHTYKPLSANACARYNDPSHRRNADKFFWENCNTFSYAIYGARMAYGVGKSVQLEEERQIVAGQRLQHCQVCAVCPAKQSNRYNIIRTVRTHRC